MSLLLLNEDELRQSVTLTEIIHAIKTASVALAEEQLTRPGAFMLRLPQVNGEVHATGAYIRNAPYYVIKVGSTFQNNASAHLPTQNGLLIVFDATTGFPAAIMVDSGYLTAMRAGAAGALTAAYLANEQLERVAVIGSGRQAYLQIKALRAVRDFNFVSVWGRTPVNVDSYARLIVEDHDLNIEIAPSPEAAVKEADLIITATTSQQPLIRAEWLKPGMHIIAVGSDRPNKQELHPNVFQKADVIVVDNFDQCAANGEIHHALEAGVITRADIQGELGDLIIGKIQGRTDPDQITVADLTGLEVQEAVIAVLVLEKALFLGLGLQTDSTATNIQSVPIG